MIKDLERKMEGLVGLDPQEQLLAILQSLSKEEIEKIPDGAGTLPVLIRASSIESEVYLSHIEEGAIWVRQTEFGDSFL